MLERYNMCTVINKGCPYHKGTMVSHGFKTGVTNYYNGNETSQVLMATLCIPPLAKITMQRIKDNLCDKIVKLAGNETTKVIENDRWKTHILGFT